MKVIFLDFDGVLNTEFNDRDKYGHLFNQRCVDNLKYIIDNTGANIVISSTWRMSGLSVMIGLWEHRKLPGKVISITTRKTDHYRGVEIEEWIDKYHPDNYVILDDNCDMLDNQLSSFICVDGLDGLSHDDSLRAIKILNM